MKPSQLFYPGCLLQGLFLLVPIPALLWIPVVYASYSPSGLCGTVIACAVWSFSTVTSTSQQFSTPGSRDHFMSRHPQRYLACGNAWGRFQWSQLERGCYQCLMDRGREHCSTTSTAWLSKRPKILKLRGDVLGLKAPGGGEQAYYLVSPWNSQHGSLIQVTSK